MVKHGSLLVSLRIVILTSIRGLFLGVGVLVWNGGYCMWGIWVVVVAKNARICMDSIADMLLKKDAIV